MNNICQCTRSRWHQKIMRNGSAWRRCVLWLMAGCLELWLAEWPGEFPVLCLALCNLNKWCHNHNAAGYIVVYRVISPFLWMSFLYYSMVCCWYTHNSFAPLPLSFFRCIDLISGLLNFFNILLADLKKNGAKKWTHGLLRHRIVWAWLTRWSHIKWVEMLPRIKIKGYQMMVKQRTLVKECRNLSIELAYRPSTT